MKKQLFILIMAIFTFSVSNAFAQLAPRPITCLTSDALHPIAGTPYSYTVTVPEPPGTKEYTWLVTQDQTFITNGAISATPESIGGSILAAADAWYNTGSTNATISLTWQSFAYDPLNPVFVLIFVKNVGADGCTTQNLKVYKIEPRNAFTLDIANQNASKVTQSGYGSNIDRCISNIVSSTYSPSAPEGILNDYGVDYLYYEVVAANWSEAWNLSVQLTNVDPLEHVTVEWTQDPNYETGFHSMSGSTVGTGSTPAIYTSSTNVTPTGGVTFVGAAGQSIYIRVSLDHSDLTNPSYEGLSDEVIVLAVDGITVPTSGTGVGDVHTVAGVGPTQTCPWVDLFANDIATQTLKARPTINAVTPTPFLPVKP